MGERGAAEFAAATTTSAASIQSTNTGCSLDAAPLVKGMSVSQISPDCGIVVQALVVRGVTVKESTVVTENQWCVPGLAEFEVCFDRVNLAFLNKLAGLVWLPPLVYPSGQFLEFFGRKLFDQPLDFFERNPSLNAMPNALQSQVPRGKCHRTNP